MKLFPGIEMVGEAENANSGSLDAIGMESASYFKLTTRMKKRL
jgi:hypothetical protein